MKLSVIGTGYVGTVSAACFAELGHEVICVDIDKTKIKQINEGIPPIHEDGLAELLSKHVKSAAGKRITATDDYDFAVANSSVSFICVGTPDKGGKIDVSIVKAASESIGKAMAKKKEYHAVVVKSTVVPETTENVVLPAIEANSGKKYNSGEFGIAMNPEFLREGKAVHDFMNPDKIVIGALDKKAADMVAELYKDLKCEITRTNPKTAEMIKYANNSFLATKISFSNEIGNICKKLGIDTYEVMKAVGCDFRIGPHFLNSGAGFGGSCFPKDVKALIGKSKELGYEPVLLDSVMEINEMQPLKMLEILKRKAGNDLKNKRIAVLGLAFKNDTDDIRESRAIPVISALLKEGAAVAAYDLLAIPAMNMLFSDKSSRIEYFDSAACALKSADACLVMTEWEEFRNLGNEFSAMNNKLIIDGRRVIDRKKLPEGTDYEGICW